jgi:TetR/AcrR family transcriptional regulator
VEREKPVQRDPDDDPDEEKEERARSQTTNNEAKILAAAEHVFGKYGFRGATTAMIAAKAGVTKPNIYYYYRNKEALYRKLLQSILAIWADSLRTIEADQDPETCIKLYLERKMEFSRTKPQLSRIFANEIISGAPYIRDQIARQTRPLLEEKAQVIQGWIDQGRISPDVDPVFLIFLMWASTQAYADFGAQMQILLGKRQLEAADFTRALNTISSVVINGVVVAPDQARKKKTKES